MKIFNKNFHTKFLYIFFIIQSLIIFFFSTVKSEGKSFDINNIDISMPFEINFNKNEVITSGFKKAFFELVALIVNSSDQKKVQNISLNEIKSMVESFSIKEEKFVNEVYFVNLGVSFNRKKIFNYLEKKNIFPSLPIKKKLIFIPILIDESKNDLLIFSENMIFDEWNNKRENFHLIDYILPTEDLEDLNIIKKNFYFIEQYDFKEITEKYYLNDSIITLIFKNKDELRILSRIKIDNEIKLKNQTFKNIDLNSEQDIKKLILNLKNFYEDYWKASNQINTSIKLILNIKVGNNNNMKLSSFEKTIEKTDSIYDYNIFMLNKDYTQYQIIFNGTSDVFLKNMKEKNYNFDTQNKVWILK